MKRLKTWLAETHGTEFELIRHFVSRFFDSDLVTEPGQWTKVVVSSFALILPAFLLLANVLRMKYRYFSKFPAPDRYQQAVQADQLWLITLSMCVVGLLTAIQWQSLFPNKRDYMALGTLPIRPRQIFFGKFVALLVLATATIVSFNALPSYLFPGVSMGRWGTNDSLLINVLVHAGISAFAGYFAFFSILAIQGILLNLFRPAWFARITGYVQGLAITLMLSGIVMSFSIGPATGIQLMRPEVAKWLPSVWILGLYQRLLGSTDVTFDTLAQRALAGFGIAVGTALVTYLISYRRHRELAMEGLSQGSGPGRQGGWFLNLLVPDPKQQGVIVFLTSTLARSNQHRIVLMGYLGFSLALVLTGIAGMAAISKPSRLLLESFCYAHMVVMLFFIAGLRHVFAIPSELRANWTFQVMEREGRGEWLLAVDRLATWPVILLVLVLPAPFEFALLGWRGIQEAMLICGAYLVLYESLFRGWQKLPFTCSYLPGQKGGFFVVLRFLAVLGMLPVMNLILVGWVMSPVGYWVVLAGTMVVWSMLRQSRRDTWSYTPLLFVEDAETEIQSLKLGTA